MQLCIVAFKARFMDFLISCSNWILLYFSQDIPRGYCEFNFSAKESAVKKPFEKHPLHIKIFDQETIHFGTAIINLGKLYSDEATR